MFTKLRAALGKIFSGGAFHSHQTEDRPMWLIVGLGNPDREYEGNRHNVGFMAVDRMAYDHGGSAWRGKFAAEIADARIGTEKVLLMKPQTYMNNSGQSVAQAAKFYKIPADHIIVLYDELDLPTAKVRVKKGGGSAGHNGIKSIDACTGDANYWRVRIGIDRPQHKGQVSSYVLSDFDADARHDIDLVCASISRNIEDLLRGSDSDFMTRIAENT